MTARILYIHSNLSSVPWDSPNADRSRPDGCTRSTAIEPPDLIWLPHLKIYQDPKNNPVACNLKEPPCFYSQQRPCGHFSLVVAPSTPSPGHYHVLYRGYGESQVGWHGETYCMIGTYRTYGDIPLATPAKVEAEKPAPRRAPKRHHTFSDSDIELGCSRPKIRRLQPGTKRQKLAG